MTNRLDHILIVDDDPEICHLLRDYLEKNGFRATAVSNGKALWQTLDNKQIELVILDLMLPGEDGLELCRNLRARFELPILILSALGEETDRIIGLEMGADDYLPKPFNPRELLARVKVILRRTRSLPGTTAETRSRLLFAGWTLYLITRHVVSPAGVIVPLSAGEFRCFSRPFAPSFWRKRQRATYYPNGAGCRLYLGSQGANRILRVSIHNTLFTKLKMHPSSLFGRLVLVLLNGIMGRLFEFCCFQIRNAFHD